MTKNFVWLIAFGFFFATLIGCPKSSGPEVIVYCALDQEFSEPILREFEKQSGIHVRAIYDTESTKTVGLVARIIEEGRTRPRCDLFWNNEILGTLRIEEQGLLDTYRPAAADSFPETFQSKKDHWFGFAGRARVLLVNTDVVKPDEMPSSIQDLLDAKWKGKIGLAKPLFGSTATHAVCLFAMLGETKAKAFFSALQANGVQILSGNKQVAEDVSSGKIAFGLTDTDDAMIELEAGFPVSIVYPDKDPGQLGTLFFPNTLALLKDGPNNEHGRKLMDFLLTPEIEARLARGESAQIPLHKNVQPDLQSQLRVETPQTVPSFEVDFEQAAKQWDTAGEYLKKEFSLVK